MFLFQQRAEIRAHPATNPDRAPPFASAPARPPDDRNRYCRRPAQTKFDPAPAHGLEFSRTPAGNTAAPPKMLCLDRRGCNSASLAESTVSCISPFAPDEEAALGFHSTLVPDGSQQALSLDCFAQPLLRTISCRAAGRLQMPHEGRARRRTPDPRSGRSSADDRRELRR